MFAWQELFSFFFFLVFFKYFSITWNVQNRSWLARASLPLSQIGNSSVKMYLVFISLFLSARLGDILSKKNCIWNWIWNWKWSTHYALLSSLSSLSFSLRSFSVYHVCFFKIWYCILHLFAILTTNSLIFVIFMCVCVGVCVFFNLLLHLHLFLLFLYLLLNLLLLLVNLSSKV